MDYISHSDNAMPPKQTTKTRGEQVPSAPVEPDEINLEGVYSEGFRPRFRPVACHLKRHLSTRVNFHRPNEYTHQVAKPSLDERVS
jgi:hypothetical protein